MQNYDNTFSFNKNNELHHSNAYSRDDSYWLISADKIFESNVNGFTNYAEFHYMEFFISRFSLYDGMMSSDSVVCARDVKIYLPPSRFCAVIQGNMASGKEISKIIIKKVFPSNGEIAVIEEKEFEKCIIQSFERNRDVVIFTFRYTSYSDSYQDFKHDGVKLGKAATKINLTTWEVK
jgi:hypothetical protein